MEINNLDNYEKDLLKSIEKDEWESVSDLDIEKERYKGFVKSTMRKMSDISVKVKEVDLLKLKTKSEEIGIPYQTIISSLIHNFVNGQLKINL